MDNKVTVFYGHSEIRSWLEAEMMPDGSLRLVGMGSRIDFDQDGKMTNHKCEPTGVAMYWPKYQAPWWKRIFS